MDSVTVEFIDYYNDYLLDADSDYEAEAGDWACKYCENQEHVNQVLDEIDNYMIMREYE